MTCNLLLDRTLMRQQLQVSITLTLKHRLCARSWFSKQGAALPSGQAGSRLTQLPVVAPAKLTGPDHGSQCTQPDTLPTA